MMKHLQKIIFSLAIFALASNAYATITIKATGYLPRSEDNLTKVDFQITVTGGMARFSSAENLENRIGIALGNSTKTLAHQEAYTGDDYEKNYWTEVAISYESIDPTTNTLTTTFDIILRPNNTYQISEIISNNELIYKIYYYEPDSTGVLNKGTPAAKDENIKLVRLAEVPSSSPYIESVAASHKQLAVTWTKDSLIEYSNGGKFDAPGVNFIIISEPDAEVDLSSAAYTFSPSNPYEDTPIASNSSCLYVPDLSGETETCSIECPEFTYLLLSKLQEISSASLSRGPVVGDGTLSIGDLENGKKYAIIAYYADDGISFSKCVLATPARNFTMTESSGEDEAKKTDISCFIATAAYGSPWTQELKLLRWFRDTYLLTFPLGKKFVSWYYQNSPEYAAIIADSSALKALTRAFLTPLVLYISILKNSPQLTAILSCIILLSLFLIAIRPRRYFRSRHY